MADGAPPVVPGSQHPSPTRVLVGGVGYRWFSDASIGLTASDALARSPWPPGVDVADLGYGALFVAQDIADARPPYERVVLLAGVARGRVPGRLYRSRWTGSLPDADEIQARIREAGAGVIELDHLLIVAEYFGALPSDVVLLEVEPAEVRGGDKLSPPALAVLPELIERARREALAPVEPSAVERRPPFGGDGARSVSVSRPSQRWGFPHPTADG